MLGEEKNGKGQPGEPGGTAPGMENGGAPADFDIDKHPNHVWMLNNAIARALMALGKGDIQAAGDSPAPLEADEEADPIARGMAILAAQDTGGPVPTGELTTFLRGGVRFDVPAEIQAKTTSPTFKRVAAMLFEQLKGRIPEKGDQGEVPLERRTCYISLDEYCERRGIAKDDKTARKNAKRAIADALATMDEIKFYFDGTYLVGGRSQRFHNGRFRILSGTGTQWENGRFVATFSPDFIEYTRDFGRFFSVVNKRMFRIDLRSNPYSFPMGMQLFYHFWLNKNHPERCTLKVQTILDANFNVKAQHKRDQVTNPFMRDLNCLVELGIIDGFQLIQENGKALPAADITADDYDPSGNTDERIYRDYQFFTSLRVKVRIKELESEFRARRPRKRSPTKVIRHMARGKKT